MPLMNNEIMAPPISHETEETESSNITFLFYEDSWEYRRYCIVCKLFEESNVYDANFINLVFVRVFTKITGIRFNIGIFFFYWFLVLSKGLTVGLLKCGGSYS